MKEREVLTDLATQLEDKEPQAARYLQILRRHKKLRKGVRMARREAACGTKTTPPNMLFVVNFQPPLNVVGQPSNVIVRAEALKWKNVPIVMEGSHGTPLEVARELLETEYGREFGAIEIMDLYWSLMSWCPGLLPDHPKVKYAKLPRLLKKNRTERLIAEEMLRAYIKTMDTRMFSVALPSIALAKALEGVSRESVVLGYSGQGHARMDKTPVPTMWGSGSGAAVVATADLRQLIGKPNDIVTIDCDREGWDGWTEDSVVVVKTYLELESPDPVRYRYFEGGSP